MPFSAYSRQHLSSDSDFYVNLYTSPWPAHPLEHFSSDSDPYVNLYTGPLVRHFDSGSASANEVSEPDPYLNANDPPMNHFTEPALSEGRLGTDRKRKAEDDHQHEGRRVRSAASPPSALAVSLDDDLVPLSARLSTGNGEGGSSWGMMGGEEYARAKPLLQFAENGYSGSLPQSTGYWASVKKGDSFDHQDDARQTGATGASNRIHVFNPSLSPEKHGTPRRYNNHQAMPEVGHAKRKRIDCDDLEDFETGENSKRIHSKTTDAPSPISQWELGPAVSVLSHSGVRLGQLLPYGEIVGFIELPPLAQLFDLHNLSLIKPEAENIWVHHTWQQIHKSAGIKRPSWPQYHWPEEIKKSGAVNKNHTFRAIKTFRELSEKLWRVPSSASFQQTLNLMLKEMDYTVLLLLANGHHDDQGAWSDRLKVLFERLDPALRQGNQLANLTSSAVASVPNAEDFHTKLQSWNLPSDLPAVMEGSPESATVSDATLPSAPLSFQEGTHAVKDEQMDMMW